MITIEVNISGEDAGRRAVATGEGRSVVFPKGPANPIRSFDPNDPESRFNREHDAIGCATVFATGMNLVGTWVAVESDWINGHFVFALKVGRAFTLARE